MWNIKKSPRKKIISIEKKNEFFKFYRTFFYNQQNPYNP
jgi:hypothetical protein